MDTHTLGVLLSLRDNKSTNPQNDVVDVFKTIASIIIKLVNRGNPRYV